jgi:hypothetical protein
MSASVTGTKKKNNGQKSRRPSCTSTTEVFATTTDQTFSLHSFYFPFPDPHIHRPTLLIPCTDRRRHAWLTKGCPIECTSIVPAVALLLALGGRFRSSISQIPISIPSSLVSYSSPHSFRISPDKLGIVVSSPRSITAILRLTCFAPQVSFPGSYQARYYKLLHPPSLA